MLGFIPVTTDSGLFELESIATRIWQEYWPDIIGKEQTDYMIKMFHSVESMKKDIEKNKYRFWVIKNDKDEIVGYTGGAPEVDRGSLPAPSHNQAVQARWSKRFFISKIYLFAEQRGKHYSSEIISFYEQLCRNEGFDVIYLTVNVNNRLGIRSYLGNGFTVIADQAIDIGNGFIMDDHVMAKEVI